MKTVEIELNKKEVSYLRDEVLSSLLLGYKPKIGSRTLRKLDAAYQKFNTKEK